MSGDQLRQLREAKSWTREQCADYLGDCSASTVNKWERGINPVPAWVEEKMLRNVNLQLPVDDLHVLLDIAREQNQDFPAILSDALRQYIAVHSAKVRPFKVSKIVGKEQEELSSKVAEEPPPPKSKRRVS